MDNTKQWIVYLRPTTIMQKLRWRLTGILPVLFADEIKLGAPGFMAIINNDTDSAHVEWFQNIQGWKCNWGFKETEIQIKKERADDARNEMMASMFPANMAMPAVLQEEKPPEDHGYR